MGPSLPWMSFWCPCLHCHHVLNTPILPSNVLAGFYSPSFLCEIDSCFFATLPQVICCKEQFLLRRQRHWGVSFCMDVLLCRVFYGVTYQRADLIEISSPGMSCHGVNQLWECTGSLLGHCGTAGTVWHWKHYPGWMLLFSPVFEELLN